MPCPCNPINISTSGGVLLSGEATISSNREYPSGGCQAGGEAIVSTNQMWDGYAAVYHLQESESADPDHYEDSAPLAIHGQGGGGVEDNVPVQDDGLFCGYSQAFAGRQYIVAPAPAVNPSFGLSVSCWAKIGRFYVDRSLWSLGRDSLDGSESWSIVLGHTFLSQITGSLRDSNGTIYKATGSTILDRDHWYHFGLVWKPGIGLSLYVDGELDGTKSISSTALAALGSQQFIGQWNRTSHLEGNIQELHIIARAVDADWMAAEHDGFCGAALDVGEEENVVVS